MPDALRDSSGGAELAPLSGTESVIYGAATPLELHAFLDAWTTSRLGSPIARVHFRAGRIDVVWGAELSGLYSDLLEVGVEVVPAEPDDTPELVGGDVAGVEEPVQGALGHAKVGGSLRGPHARVLAVTHAAAPYFHTQGA